MIVTATEFKTNFGKYLDMLRSEECLPGNWQMTMMQRC